MSLMYVIVEVQDEGYGGHASWPIGVIGPFDSEDDAKATATSLEGEASATTSYEVFELRGAPRCPEFDARGAS